MTIIIVTECYNSVPIAWHTHYCKDKEKEYAYAPTNKIDIFSNFTTKSTCYDTHHILLYAAYYTVHVTIESGDYGNCFVKCTLQLEPM